MVRSKGFLLFVVVSLAIAVSSGYDWGELRYIEFAFERDCPDFYPEQICAGVVEREGAACEEASRSAYKSRPLIPNRYRECLMAAADVAARDPRQQ